LKSVDIRGLRHIEHIIVVGASQDGTLEITNGCPMVWRCILSEPDGGIYHAMNKGIALAIGDVQDGFFRRS